MFQLVESRLPRDEQTISVPFYHRELAARAAGKDNSPIPDEEGLRDGN
jgi:hypothetical protein